MEEDYKNDIKNVIQFNLVPKVEPNDGEFVLSGEFVDGVPPAPTMPLPHTEDCKAPLSKRITTDNPFGLKESKITVKGCIQELSAIKTDIKDEPEENKYYDSFASQKVDDPSADKKITELQTNAQPRTSWIYALNKARLKEELWKVGLPTKGTMTEQRRLLCIFIKRQNYQPEESKTPYPVTPEDPKPTVDVSRTLIPTTSVSKGELRSTRNNSASLPETTVSPAKERKKRSYCYEDTSSSENDNDESLAPQRSSRISASSKTMSAVKKGKSNKSKKLHLKNGPDKEKAIDVSLSLLPTTSVSKGELWSPRSNSASLPEKELPPAKKKKKLSYYFELSSDSPQINDNASNNPLNYLKELLTSLPTPEKAALPGKKNDSDGDKAETGGVLWSCCDMQFELFSAYNNHKAQVHLIEELTCSICIDQSFSSTDKIEKHYLDAHTDSSWTSFHCLECRLVFGIKSSFLDHKTKCCEAQSVCSGILDSVLDFVATRKKSKTLKVNEDTAFKLSCCENIFETFEDFVIHKLTDHNISVMTCGLCLCVKDTRKQLKNHYYKFHFFKLWKLIELKSAKYKKGVASTVSSSTQIEDIFIKADDGPSDSDNVRAKPVQCSALQDGILCQCCDCTKPLEEKRSFNATAIGDLNELSFPFQCEPCNLRFRYRTRLNRHLRTHEGDKRFPCDMCGAAFTISHSLKTHKLRKHSSNPIKQVCSICDKVFISKSSLKVHIDKLHTHVNKKKIKVTCEYCGKVFARRSGYLTHIRGIHYVGEELICDHCNNIFYDKMLLVNHMKRLHLPHEKHECQKCDHTFKTKYSLHLHNIKVHTDSQFYCEVCGKMFKTKVHLGKHMSVHSDDKPFICQTCGKRFKRDVNLQQHQYTHSDIRPHACDICGQTFRLRTHVKQHMAVHGIIKKQKCPVCEKTFAKKKELKCHLSTHGI